jgi:hypothetical protein
MAIHHKIAPAGVSTTIVCTARRDGWPKDMAHVARFTNDPDGADAWVDRWLSQGWIVTTGPAEVEPPARPFNRAPSTQTHYTHPDGLGAAQLGVGRVGL